MIRPTYTRCGNFAGFVFVDPSGEMTPAMPYKALARMLIELREGVDCDFVAPPVTYVAPEIGPYGVLQDYEY